MNLVPLSCRYWRPLHTLLSALIVAVGLGVLVWAAESQAAVRRCRRSHPTACLAAVLAFGFFVLWTVGGACTFLLSIVGPVLCEFPPENTMRACASWVPRADSGLEHLACMDFVSFQGFSFPMGMLLWFPYGNHPSDPGILAWY